MGWIPSPGITETAHAQIDHTGIPGVGSGSGGAAYAETIGDGNETEFTVTHDLDSTDVVVQLWDLTGSDPVEATGDADSIEATDADTVTVTFSGPPAADAYRVVVLASGGSSGGGGGGGFAIPIQNLDGWFDASTLGLGYSDNDEVVRVPSGIPPLVMVATGSPTIHLNQLNGLSVLRTSSGNGYNALSFQSPPVSRYTAFAVFKHRTGSVSGDQMIFGGDEQISGAQPSYFPGIDSTGIFVDNGTRLYGPAADDQWHRATVIRFGTQAILDVDGSLVGPSSVGSTNPDFLSLGLRRNSEVGSTRGNYFDGDIAEALFYSRRLSSAEIVQVENYLSSKWGV